jgi:predicted nucleic acid-binding protein
MIYVLDSNVALKWVLPEADSDKALRLRADMLAGVHELLAPDVFPVEVAHALTRAERKGDIPVGDADVHLLNILSSSPQFHPSLTLLRRAVAISSSARIGVYDCLYVSLAEREGCEFITADDKLLKKLGPQFAFIVALASMP